MPQRFPYVEVDPILGQASALPYAPITLQFGDRKVQVSGLIDSGSTLNVLPFDVGLQLSAVWEDQSAERVNDFATPGFINSVCI